MYSHSSSHSTTSLSDVDEDPNMSTFFPVTGSDSTTITAPAQWLSKRRLQQRQGNRPPQSHSPVSHLPPEILINVLKHLHSSRDLYRCLLVSRAWCECSVELLWHKPSFPKLSTLVKMMRVISRPDQTFTYARFIRRLNFLFLGAELTDSLFSRLSQCDRLERLTLALCSSITDDALTRVLSCCHSLVAIDLTNVIDTTDKAVVALANSAKRLQGINLAGCKKVTNNGVFALAKNCPLLRRVKLSGLELITDEPVSALAKSCPLLLEIDLNHCKQITDGAIRDLWTYSLHMREMRLSHCVELTDAAFPAPFKSDVVNPPSPTPNPFPHPTQVNNEYPPLVLNRKYEHLRMLDVTACANLTDEAVEGIVSHAPKIRNLVFSKCSQLTDKSVETICTLGKHLHYLHLGHASNITDRSVRMLARYCTRLRYVDFANCTLLSDMSVFELASLPKLRRIGLVRVNKLTDEAIYALAERHATLERIHLSYCDQITVMAIHFLVQKLHKLTHLSLTGIPSFRKPELQRFCRPPPSEFNMSQRAAFCVYSGAGVSQLRAYLADLFNTMTEDTRADETEYDDDFDHEMRLDGADVDMEDGEDGDDDYSQEQITADDVDPTSYRTYRAANVVASAIPFSEHVGSRLTRPSHPSPTVIASRGESSSTSRFAINDHANYLPARHLSPQGQSSHNLGQLPIVETSSDVASNRSTGTNLSNGAGFFRDYQERFSRSNGVLTPDLNYAEIGHGRGAGGSSAHNVGPSHPRTVTASTASVDRMADLPPGLAGIRNGHTSYQSPVEYLYRGSIDNLQAPVEWPRVLPALAGSYSAYDVTGSTQSPVGVRDQDSRSRSVKRSLRNTIQVAEHYATSLFGRGSSGSGRDREGGPNGSTDHGPRAI